MAVIQLKNSLLEHPVNSIKTERYRQFEVQGNAQGYRKNSSPLYVGGFKSPTQGGRALGRTLHLRLSTRERDSGYSHFKSPLADV